MPDDTTPLDTRPKLAIILEGGVVQSVVSNLPDVFANIDVMVIDYDTEGADEDQLSIVRFDLDATFGYEEAIIGHHKVELAAFDFAAIEPRNCEAAGGGTEA